ncbi:hypothetical protein EW026_g4882 [Hermanssonia centrifuga]|uniref:CCHC-type domain-containing protein n=1 Tax=Hermanssonia centrifuga TaxID=98765 RepID=A0A4S4KFU0_9APHY|nr:hypothetical protein EW026_g4882 [Hermanssonia centrifuga]
MSSPLIKADTITKFTGYAKWNISFKSACHIAQCWGVVAGTTTKPATGAAEIAAWETKNNQGLGSLCFSQSRLREAKCSKAFNIFKKFYAGPKLQANKPLCAQIDKLLALKQDAINAGVTISDQYEAFALLRVAPPEYSNVITLVLQSKDITTITGKQIIDALLQEESLRTTSAVAGCVSNTTNKPKKCGLCGKKGHLQENCWDDPKNAHKRKGKGKGKPGNNNNLANNSATVCNEYKEMQIDSSEAGTVTLGTSTISIEDDKKSSWMLDSGCSNYVTNDFKDFIPGTYVAYPLPGVAQLAGTGHTMEILGIGCVYIEHTNQNGKKWQLLFDCLYIPLATGKYLAPKQMVEQKLEIRLKLPYAEILDMAGCKADFLMHARSDKDTWWLDACTPIMNFGISVLDMLGSTL